MVNPLQLIWRVGVSDGRFASHQDVIAPPMGPRRSPSLYDSSWFWWSTRGAKGDLDDNDQKSTVDCSVKAMAGAWAVFSPGFGDSVSAGCR